MMTELSQVQSITQIVTYLYAILLGSLLCLCYDVLRAVRQVGAKNPFLIFFQDVGFFLFAAVLVFSFLMIRCQGVLRLYVFAGIIPGAIITRYAISRYFMGALVFSFGVFKKTIHRICFPVKWILTTVQSKSGRAFGFVYQKYKNIFKRKKKPLENGGTLDV